MLIAFYFMNTSLSTIGFGDFKPISDAERLVCVVTVISGVIVFSFIMSQVIQQMSKLDDYFEDKVFNEIPDLQ